MWRYLAALLSGRSDETSYRLTGYLAAQNLAGAPAMTKPIFATPKMDRAESKRIYGDLRKTEPASEEKAARFREADGVFSRARDRAAKAAGEETGRKKHSR
jgi:hypothetical protein